MAWTKSQLTKLEKIYAEKPAWMTDNELAGRISSQFKKTKEAVRWQMRQLHKDHVIAFPKILLLDIETQPIEALVWGTRKQYVHPAQIKKDWSISCWAAKWLFDGKTYGQAVTPEEAKNHQDASILPEMWRLMDEAHVIITQNGDNFDLKKLNTRFLLNGLSVPPSFYKSIDTWKIMTANFAFTYGKLDWVGEMLGVGRKMETSFTWWKEVEAGNKKYIDMMLKYNMQDVSLLEEVYLKLRPWMKSHPNLGVFAGDGMVDKCPACTSLNLNWNSTYSTPLGLYKAFRCEDCGAIGRATKKAYKITGVNVRN